MNILHLSDFDPYDIGQYDCSAYECETLLKFLEANSIPAHRLDFEIMRTQCYILPDKVKIVYDDFMIAEGACLLNNSFKDFTEYLKNNENARSKINMIDLTNISKYEDYLQLKEYLQLQANRLVMECSQMI